MGKQSLTAFLKYAAKTLKTISINKEGDGKVSEQEFLELLQKRTQHPYTFFYEDNCKYIDIVDNESFQVVAKILGFVGGDVYGGFKIHFEIEGFITDYDLYINNMKISDDCFEKNIYYFRHHYYTVSEKKLLKIDTNGKIVWKADLPQDFHYNHQFGKIYGLSMITNSECIGVQDDDNVCLYEVETGKNCGIYYQRLKADPSYKP